MKRSFNFILLLLATSVFGYVPETHFIFHNASCVWDAINPNGHAAQTTDALFDIPLHPIQTIQNLARGVEQTFANFGAGFGSGNFEKAGEAGFGIALMLVPELRLGKLGKVGEAGRVVEAAEGALSAGARTEAASLSEQLALQEAQAGAGQRIMQLQTGGLQLLLKWNPSCPHRPPAIRPLPHRVARCKCWHACSPSPNAFRKFRSY